MNRVRPWWPVAAAFPIVVLAMAAALHTSRPVVIMPTLPGPVRVTARALGELQSEVSRPLFAPSRSNLPAGAADNAPPPAPPPTLSGIVLGGGRAVALVQGADGKTVLAHVGDVIDGWTVAAIRTRQVTFVRGDEKQEIELSFDKPKESAADDVPSD